MIAQNLQKVKDNIAASCERSGRKVSEVTLICVSKKQTEGKISEAISLNEKNFGENFVDQIIERKEVFPSVNWHLIGPIQSKKVGKILGVVSLIHSIDRIKIARLLNEKLMSENKVQDVLLQINLSGEKSKSGFTKNEIQKEMLNLKEMNNLKIRGFMTLPPFSEEPDNSRKYFAELRELLFSTRSDFELGADFCELSMGTTQDYCVAIEEGATLVRVGTAIFGSREG